MLQDKKGQGLVTGVISGIGFLVITTIVIFLIVSTLNTSGVIARDSGAGVAQANLTLVDEAGVTLTTCNAAVDGSASGLTIINATGGETLTAANYSVSACTLGASAASEYNNTAVNITGYTYTFDSEEQISADQMISNFTSGVDNVSEKLPTVLLVVAVVILFGAIVLLVKQSRSIAGGGAGL